MMVAQMSPKEISYRITGRLSFDYQLVIQAQSLEEAEYFAGDIDLDRWTEVNSDWEIIDVSRNYFLKRIKNDGE